MRTTFISRPLLVAFSVAVVAVIGGCSANTSSTGPYAEVKESWDSPRSSELEDSLRNRLMTTQRDN